MKKLNIMAALLLGAFALTSCESDREDNPVMMQPTTFTLSAPAVGTNIIDLVNSASIELRAAAQPEYGAPLHVTYGAQMSLNQQWSDSASVYTIDVTTDSLTFVVPATEIDKGIMVLRGYSSESQLTANQVDTVYMRLSAKPVNMGEENTIYSNVVSVYVYPYYMELSNADPVLWWLIGTPIGDGAWTNTNGTATYLSVFPLTPEPEYEFDTKTGLGELQTTIYLPANSGFKIIRDLGSWNEQWGDKDGAPYSKKGGNDEGSDFKEDEDGFYTITLNTKNEVLTIEKAEISPATYSSVSIIGAFSTAETDYNWDGDIDMQPATAAGANNHMWTAQVTFTAGGQFKFRADHDWGTNWGYGSEDGDLNIFGVGVGGGKNIGIEAGTYTLYLNDIDGYFRIIKHE